VAALTVGLEAIGNGIKTRLETITGLRVFAPNELPDTITETPCALIIPDEIEYDITFLSRKSIRAHFRIIILVTKQDSPSALNAILDYADITGTYSVRAAIYGDSTLNSSADDCRVERCLGAGNTTWGGHTYLSTEFEIWAIA